MTLARYSVSNCGFSLLSRRSVTPSLPDKSKYLLPTSSKIENTCRRVSEPTSNRGAGRKSKTYFALASVMSSRNSASESISTFANTKRPTLLDTNRDRCQAVGPNCSGDNGVWPAWSTTDRKYGGVLLSSVMPISVPWPILPRARRSPRCANAMQFPIVEAGLAVHHSAYSLTLDLSERPVGISAARPQQTT